MRPSDEREKLERLLSAVDALTEQWYGKCRLGDVATLVNNMATAAKEYRRTLESGPVRATDTKIFDGEQITDIAEV